MAMRAMATATMMATMMTTTMMAMATEGTADGGRSQVPTLPAAMRATRIAMMRTMVKATMLMMIVPLDHDADDDGDRR